MTLRVTIKYCRRENEYYEENSKYVLRKTLTQLYHVSAFILKQKNKTEWKNITVP